jgi:tRNA (guanine37-N1)-methyltransferase
MNIFIHTIFPEIFESFLNTSLIKKAQEKWILNIKLVNIRDFCVHKQKQVDDKIYGWGVGMLIKAKPVIDAIENTIKENNLRNFKIIYLAPSDNILNQEKCFSYSKEENIILLAWRYEWIDYRVEEYFKDKYWNFERLSIWKYILMGWELPAMVFIESTTRLIPWVIKEKSSYEDESYNPNKNMQNIEYPQYTRPAEIYWYKVPDILLSGHDAKIKEWKENNELKN